MFKKLMLACVACTLIFAPTIAGEKKDIVDTAVAAGQFKTLVKAVGAADLVKTLKSKGPFTVFAPTDAAFAKLPKGTIAALLKDKAKLKQILLYHVVSGKVMAKQAVKLDGKDVKMVSGDMAKVTVKKGSVMIGKAKVVKADIDCTNGVIHVIDTVILPPMKKPASQPNK